jgi:uncharacterized protein (TIGR01777 family)
MRILLTGGSGFIGRACLAALAPEGYEVTVLTRDKSKARGIRGRVISWSDFYQERYDYDAVINLMGENIGARRWSLRQKERILHSRAFNTQQLLSHIGSYCRLKLLLSASAVGYYPYSERQEWDEDAAGGSGFLAEVCRAWEQPVAEFGKSERTVILRLGNVISAEGGIMRKLLPLYKLRLSGLLGPRERWMSWIHIKDVVKIVDASLKDARFSQIINVVAPEPVKAGLLEDALHQRLEHKFTLRVPALLYPWVMGEMSELVLGHQRVISKKLVDMGYIYEIADIAASMDTIVGRERLSIH